MKRLFLPFLFILILLSPKASHAEDGKEFINRYKNCSLTDGCVVYSKVCDFKNKDKKQLLEQSKIYFDTRIQTKATASSTNTDYSYTDNSLIITEEYNEILVSKTPKLYAAMEYIYRMDIKDEKIRLSIICSKFWLAGQWFLIKNYYPFNEKSKRFNLKVFDQFAEYVDNVFLDFEKKISDPSFLDTNW